MATTMGLRPALLCLLASMLLYSMAAKDCKYNGTTYKDGDTIEMECEFCECSNGEARDCERKESCNRKPRRSLSEDALKMNYLDEPGIIESSFNRKKRSLLPDLDDEFIDNIKIGKGSLGIKQVSSINTKGSKVITGTNTVIKTAKKTEKIQVQKADFDENEETRIQEELVKAAAQRDMTVQKNVGKNGQNSDKSHINLDSHKDGSDKTDKSPMKASSSKGGLGKHNTGSHEDSSESHGSHEENSEEHSKGDKKHGSHEDESEEHGKEHKKPGSHEDTSKEQKKRGSHEDKSEEHSNEHKKPGTIEDKSKEHSKEHKKPGSHEDTSKEHKKTGSHEDKSEEHGKEHKKPGTNEDKSEEHSKEHKKPGSHEDTSKEHKKPGSHEDKSEEHGKEHKKPGSHEDKSEEHSKDHKKPGTNKDKSEEHSKEHKKPGKNKDESEEHNKEHKKPGKNKDESEEHNKEHKKPGSNEDESEEHVKEHIKPGSHEDESEEHVKEHIKPGSHEDESEEHGKEHIKPGSHEDESEEHNKSDSDKDDNISENEEGCLFNHASMDDGESIKLRCLECTCNRGTVSCVRDFQCPGLCSVSSFQMIRTFDGSLYNSPGTCSYMLVKTSDFAVYLYNTQCEENKEAVCIQAVEVHIGLLMKVKLLSDGNAVTDTGVLDLPHHINDLITIRRSSSVFMEVVSTLGFSLHYDFKGHRVYVIMDTDKKDTTKGLCGTYNDNRNDDYISSNGMLESVADLFSVSWKVDQSCSEEPRSELDLDSMVKAKDMCDVYLDESIFADCRSIIEVTSYKQSCTSSMYFGEELGGMCSALADYAYHCSFAGITVPFRSSFSECELNCQDPLIPSTLSEFSNRDCREYTDHLLVFPAASMLNEVCICPSDQYYDSTLDSCVNGDQCPCYANNRVYKVGEMVKFSNGKECGCQRIMECSDENIPTPAEPIQCPNDEVYSDCVNGVGKSCEKSCLNLEMVDQTCPADCVPGCICPYGSYRDDEDQCVSISDCKCIHGGDKYNPGETMVQDCNTCTCNDGRFECTRNACTSVCNAYGESQFILFDKVWKKFPTADCEMILVMSAQNPPFAVTATSVASRLLAGSYSTKNITIQFGETYVLLTEFEPQVMYNPTVSHHSEVNIYRAGFYTVVDFPEGLTVYYDLHLDVVIQLQPHLQGKVEGMCGDADGTTTYEFSRGNMLQYSSQFLAAGCTYDRPSLPPPSGNHTIYVEERCSLLKSDAFFPCHSVVSVDSYYSACVEETASCREGESCLCFCTAVAAYARACCRKGISVDWRTADTCPAPCEYYNREAGEGPYHLTNMNQLRVVADLESGQAILSSDDDKEDLKASFMVTPGLYKDMHSIRPPISLESALYPNYFIVQDEDGTVHLEKWQSSVNFRKRATFIWRKNRWIRGYDALESFTQRGYYLTTGSDNSLSVSKYIKSSTQTASFKLTMESFGLPFFSMCLWRYKTCESPCIKTCQDPHGTKCTLSLNVEGCFPHCAEGFVFDEKTHRCVDYKYCTNEPTPAPTPLPSPTPEISTTPSDECKHVTCSVPDCKVGAIPRKTQHQTNPCCEEYICECSACPTPPVCGLGLVATPQYEPEKRCCPLYTCECGLCPPSPDCRKGFILKLRDEQHNHCCHEYECVPDTTTPAPTTITPQITTTRDMCDDVSCSFPECSRTGETLRSAPSDDPCCPAYTCACLPCPVPPACDLGYILDTRLDKERDCCPSHTCVCPECPAPPHCHHGSVLRKTTNPDRPCCPEYECEPMTTPETITTPTPCHEPCIQPSCVKSGAFLEKRERTSGSSCCDEYECVCSTCPPVTDCGPGFEKETHFKKETMCCPEYACHLVPATTPAIPTTASPTPAIPTTTPRKGCEGVTCPNRSCHRDGEVATSDPSDHSCCPRFFCECLPCPPKLVCESGLQPTITIDPEKHCCPNQTCPNESKPKTTLPPTTTTDKCAHVTCAKSHCGKTGAVPVDSADPCCAVCECHECPSPHDCGFGLIAKPHFDSTRQCCPTFTCECPSCPPVIECEPGYTLTSHTEDQNPCCPVHHCVLSTTTPRSTTPQNPCDHVTCSAPRCSRAGEHPETDGSIVDCCVSITCVCSTCDPAPECGLGLMSVETFDPAVECCPRYTCECPPTCPPPEDCTPGFFLSKVETENVCCNEFECVPYTTVPTTPTPTDMCHLVTCALPGCKKTGELPHQLDEGSGKGSGEDPCCPEYVCKCQTCPTPPACGRGFDTEETFDVKADCCPSYRCVPQTTVVPPTTPTPHNPCQGVTCAEKPQCTKIGSRLIEQDGSGEDMCCHEYDCGELLG
ncbi:hypothetical protein NDU88_010015 [Pleurodeles waltl]|uniref:VWFD domain-containing protein n=1 Tax=Pleurodeles waltl TaxID=8319 RepID=A0AAV7PXG6_PLEWA|nr:hypothetical protein NDU88_010015 [Pleurodeles waltl]